MELGSVLNSAAGKDFVPCSLSIFKSKHHTCTTSKGCTIRVFNTFAKRLTGAAARTIRVPKKLRNDSVVVTRKGER